MRAVFSVLLMLTVAPLVAAITLVCCDPVRWAGSLDPLSIVVMAIFGIFTAPLWLTYVPALILTPLLMKRVSASPAFYRVPVRIVIGLSMVVGAVAGVCVMLRLVLMVLRDSAGYGEALTCASAGAVAGAVTLPLICLLYRYGERRTQPGSSPGGGPAVPPVLPGAAGGPPSVG